MLYPDQQARRDIIVDTLNGHSSYSLNGNLSLLKKTSKRMHIPFEIPTVQLSNNPSQMIG